MFTKLRPSKKIKMTNFEAIGEMHENEKIDLDQSHFRASHMSACAKAEAGKRKRSMYGIRLHNKQANKCGKG